MEAIVQERIKRDGGDFLDADGEYEVFSSLLTNEYQLIREKVSDKLIHDGRTVEPQQLQKLAVGHAYFFHFKVIWSIMFLAFIAWISIRWMDLASPWNNKSKERKENGNNGSEVLSSTSSKDGCTRATAKAFSHGNNLSAQFEKVVDREEEVTVFSASVRKTSKTDDTLSHFIETTKATVTQKMHVHTTTVDKAIEQKGDKVEEKGAEVSSSKEEHETDANTFEETQQVNGRRLHHTQRSGSPPPLGDEPVNDVAADSPHTETESPTKRAIPSPSESLQSSTSCYSDPPMGDMAHTSQPSPSPPYSPLIKSDSSRAPAMPFVPSTEQTPQSMAQEFVQNVEIIEKVLLRSSSNVDPSCAVDLAMMHQSSHFKMREQRQHMAHQERQQSSIRYDKYDEYLKELSKTWEQCMEACSRSINHSMLLCLLLEAWRHAAKLMYSLEYFSMKEASAILLHMACGCEDDEEFERDDVPSHASYISMLSTYFLSTLESSVIKFADYASCIMAYGVILICWQAMHGMLRTLHCPALFHQILNGMVLVMYLAQNPGAWDVVVRNLELYSVWFKVQGTLTIALFVVTVICYVKNRSYILERQQQIVQADAKGNREGMNHLTRCNARRRIAHMEDLSWIISVVPTMILGLIVLTTTETIER